MKMNRARFNHMRHERENDGLPQVLTVNTQMAVGSPLNALRKTTYTRTELMQRPPIASGVNRSKRLSNIGSGNRPVGNGPTGGPDSNANRRTGGPRGHFLPRVARLNSGNNNSNNNSNNNKALMSRSKSPFGKKVKAGNGLEGHPQKNILAAGQEPLVEELEQQPKEERPYSLIRVVGASGLGVAMGNSGCSSSSSILSSSSAEIKLVETLYLPDEKNQSFVYLCKPEKQVKDLVMVRPLRDSIDNVDMQLQLADGSSEAKELVPDPVDKDPLSKDKSPRGRAEQPKQPKKREQPEQQKLDLVLDTQLLDVLKRQKQLQKLAEHAMDRCQEKQTDGNTAQTQAGQSPKLNVGQVRQNIPSLQREIKLLQQLGEKLEATLLDPNNTSSLTYDLASTDSSSKFYTPRSTMELCGSKSLRIVEFGCRRVEHMGHLSQQARAHYYARSFGCVREYRIETKTLTELKTADDMQCFYMPLAEDGGMQRTSFRMLRENPNVLLQQLRPLSPDRPFNLLEHDAMFFNSLLGYGELQMASSGVEHLAPARESGGATANQLMSAGGMGMGTDQLPFSLLPYSRLSVRSTGLKANAWSHEHMKRLLLKGLDVQDASDVDELQTIKKEHSISSQPSLDRKPDDAPMPSSKPKSTRRNQRRPVPPLKTPEIFMKPRHQTRFLKNVLVGFIQVAVFLVLIMAFTYPDARC